MNEISPENIKNNSDVDYAYVNTIARIATYDDFKSAPRVTEINPAPTTDYIEAITTTIYTQSKQCGGNIPYTVIREVSENFIHARFKEIVVSIFDDGNTIRFTDQGPGIKEKENAIKPGFSSAIEPMKSYIRGVGSGFPIVCDYLDEKNGSIVIEDNLNSGAVITISLKQDKTTKPTSTVEENSNKSSNVFAFNNYLSEREKQFLKLLFQHSHLGVTEMSKYSQTAASTTFTTFQALENYGLVVKTQRKERKLTDLGLEVIKNI